MKKPTTLKTFISKLLCTTLILSFVTSPALAYQNYVHTTTTNENYSAVSPVGRFENHSTNGAVAPIYNYNNYAGYPTYIGQPMYNTYAEYPSNQVSYLSNDNEVNAQQTDKERKGYDTYQYPQVAMSAPMVNYGYNVPMYTAGATYANPNYNQTASIQDIEVPQNYNKTVTTTQEYVDTREKADKIIDRGAKVLGSLALVGAVTGLIIHAAK